MPTADPPPVEDGRVARGRRSREAFVEAFLHLVGEGGNAVTGADVAAAAGLSVRSFWTHFADMEALYDAAAHALWHHYTTTHRTPSAEGTLDERVARWAQQRSAELDEVTPYAATAALREPFSPALRASRARFISSIVTDVEVVFAPELSGDDAGTRRDAVVAVSSYSCWTAWRRDLGLTTTAARDALDLAVRGALTAPTS